MSLGNVNTCCTIIINYDYPSIEEPHKIKKTWLEKDMFHCCSYCRCSYVLIYIAAFFVLRQKGCCVKILTSCFTTCSLF